MYCCAIKWSFLFYIQNFKQTFFPHEAFIPCLFFRSQHQVTQLTLLEVLNIRHLFCCTGANLMILMVSFWAIRCSTMATRATTQR